MERKNKGLIAMVVILTILVLGLGGYIVYDKINIKTDDNNVDYNEKVNSKKESNQIDKTSTIRITDFYFDSVAIVNEGSVYINVYGSTPEIDNLFGDGTYQTLVKTRKNYEEYTFNNFEYNNSKFKGIKLDVNNVEKVYSYNYGQTISNNYGLILLNQDKTLSIISLYSLINGKTVVKNISNLSDVESIIYEDNNGMSTYAVKTSGEKVNLNDYIPKDYKQF